jgi:hypothetical protein
VEGLLLKEFFLVLSSTGHCLSPMRTGVGKRRRSRRDLHQTGPQKTDESPTYWHPLAKPGCEESLVASHKARGRYWAQLPKSRDDISSIGNLSRMPCSKAIVRPASLAPGRNADTCGPPLSTARRSAVVRAVAAALNCRTATGPIWPTVSTQRSRPNHPRHTG